MLAIFVFVMAYMGYHVVSALSVPIRTNTAILYKTEETAALSGLVVRDEATIELPSGFMEFRVAEGERVAKNQVIAVTYSDPSAMRIHDEALRLEARLKHLEYVESRGESTVSASELERMIQESLIRVMSSASTGRIHQLRGDALELKTSLFRREYAFGNLTGLPEAISELKIRLESLQLQASGVEGYVRSPATGLFCPRSDGLEAKLSPTSMSSLTSAEVKELLKSPEFAHNAGIGKLVFGMDWFLVAELESNIAPSEGSTSEIRLSDGHELRMKVHSSEKLSDDARKVIFSCSSKLSSGQVIFTSSTLSN